MSVKDVAVTRREYFLAGWTVQDIMDALDWLPDGRRHPNSGIPTTKEPWRLRGWLNARLGTWRNVDGDVLRSVSQREAAAEAETARRQKILHRQAEHAARLDHGHSPARTTALAAIRALFDKGRAPKLSQKHR